MSGTRSFVDAISERYGAEDDSSAYSADAFNVSGTVRRNQRNRQWEMVGMDMAREKQSQYNKIRVLGLQNCKIARAEKEAGEISKMKLERVRELDLSDNKELQAAEVDAIVAALGKSLVELQLSGTDIGNTSTWSSSPAQSDLSRPSSAAAAAAAAAAPAVAAAIDSTVCASSSSSSNNSSAADATSSSASPAAAAAAAAPSQHQPNRPKQLTSVQSLASTCCSDISSVPSSPFRSEGWARIRTLALNRCGISWQTILDAFPAVLTSLTSLHCESNGIVKICNSSSRLVSSAAAENAASPSASTSSSPVLLGPLFPTLTELNLSFNNVTCGLDDEEMNSFFCKETPKLVSLNLTGNNIFVPSMMTKEGPNERKEDNDGVTTGSSSVVCYLTLLTNLYIAGNKQIMQQSKSAASVSGEEPLQALEWIRAACPALKALRVAYDDFFGISPSAAASASASTAAAAEDEDAQQQQQQPQQQISRPQCNLSEVQQRSLVIASVGQVEMLNSGTVRDKERLDAEMLYLQVAKAKQKQQEAAAATAAATEKDGGADQSSSTASTSTSAAAGAAAPVVVSATQRFFPWSLCPRLPFLEEKHKGVVLTGLGGGAGACANSQASNSISAALNYTLQLTFRVMAKDADAPGAEAGSNEHGGGDDKQSDTSSATASAEIEGTSRSQRRERAKKTNATALADDVTRTVPGNMTVGKLRSFVASIFPALAPLSRQKKLQAYPRESTVIPPTVLAAVDDEQPLVLCGVPSAAVVEVFV